TGSHEVSHGGMGFSGQFLYRFAVVANASVWRKFRFGYHNALRAGTCGVVAVNGAHRSSFCCAATDPAFNVRPDCGFAETIQVKSATAGFRTLGSLPAAWCEPSRS